MLRLCNDSLTVDADAREKMVAATIAKSLAPLAGTQDRLPIYFCYDNGIFRLNKVYFLLDFQGLNA